MFGEAQHAFNIEGLATRVLQLQPRHRKLLRDPIALSLIAANVLVRQFDAARPNQRWVGDTTEFLIGGSAKLYLAAILDLCSRFIAGWALSAVNDRHLTLRALETALKRRCPEAGLLHHWDQGCTYASEDYRTRLEQHGIVCSMRRRGNCYRKLLRLVNSS